MNKHPKTYQEWLQNKGVKGEVGSKFIMTYKFAKYITETSQSVGKLLGNSFGKAIVERGLRVGKVILSQEKDPSCRTYEFSGLIETKQGELPIEYMVMAYSAWQEAESALQIWENKSLWQYFKGWFERKMQRRIIG